MITLLVQFKLLDSVDRDEMEGLFPVLRQCIMKFLD